MFDSRVTVSLRLAKLIEEISSLRERIVSAPIQLAWRPALEKEAAIRNAMGSTAIEGYVLSLPEVKALAQGEAPSRNLSKSERAVLNYLSALKYIEKKAQQAKIEHKDIFQLHRIIAEGASEPGPLGVYRAVQNYIVSKQGVVYTPPHPGKVQKLMADLVSWVNSRSQDHVAAVASGVLHYQFVKIHPFVDGNGRVARALGTWELLRRRFDTLHIFAIDDLIYEHKDAYYRALKMSSDEKGISGWLEFYLEVIAESLDRAWRRIASIPKRKLSRPMVLTPKQEKLLTLLRDGGPLSSNELAQALKITVQGVHFLLQPLLREKIAAREGGRKTGKFKLV